MSKRTRILVDPPVQWAIARRVFLHWCMLLVCLVTISGMMRLLFAAGEQPFMEALKSAVMAQAPLLCIMFILMPVFLRDTLKLSNRFAGPMYRLRTVLAEMAGGGEGQNIKFRGGDFWQEVAGDFNEVRSQIQSLQARNEQLEAELQELKERNVVA